MVAAVASLAALGRRLGDTCTSNSLHWGVADVRHQPFLLAARQRVSFRSVKEAVAAARDGDQILLLAGIHNGMG